MIYKFQKTDIAKIQTATYLNSYTQTFLCNIRDLIHCIGRFETNFSERFGKVSFGSLLETGKVGFAGQAF